ncbi:MULTISPECIES: transporter substrate-binding domain-containing protein [unclassified Pseudodesulfovibrio]|uniref:substrate-binding periplasmic protein n=1 Tax=unclassified Pseudodesulfovibrio TaxID=2661612 RepID=UPI000FEB8E0B|nr:MULTISPECIES: transporter substrate-binding domain-containing protein [unclassified Pseudodesulfovibrio]MCJ2164909.1 transporter substrate-binding domain-containing protein [Pseudodesulfovibrio sp. S3-i]RWU03728.1 hypothetical protein DWB63_09710 [Pseudodesulfovibrio sp. S3]
MRQRIAIWSCVLVILLASVSFAAGPIVIFGNDCKPPKAWIDGHTPKGILVDILREIEKRTDLVFDIQLMPWKRSYMQALECKGGIIGLSMNTERLDIFDYSSVLCYDELRLVVLKGREFQYNTMEDVKGKTLGYTRGASYGDEFDLAKKTIFIASEDVDPVCRLRMVLAGRIDAALIGPGEASVRYIIENNDILKRQKDKLVILPTPFTSDPNYIGFHKDMCAGDDLKKINHALRSMWADGAIQAIIDSY